MSRKKRTEENNKQEARAAERMRNQEHSYMRRAIIAGVLLALLTCLSCGESAKVEALVLIVIGIVLLVCRRKTLAPRFGAVAVALTAYCLMLTISSFYAPSGKFALNESIQYISALALFVIVLALEPKAYEKSGLYSAAALECGAAVISLLSIDMAGAKLLSTAAFNLLGAVTSVYEESAALDRGHLATIFQNSNIFAGVAGLAILLGLGSLRMTEDRHTRRVLLSSLAINAAAFLDAFSRGAMVVLALCFLVYLFSETGAERAHALVEMLETAVFSAIAAAVGYVTAFGSEGRLRFAALAATLLCAAALAAFDEKIGQRAAQYLEQRTKAITVIFLSLLGALAVFAAAALSLTGPMVIGGEKTLYRATYPSAGAQTLRVEADGDVALKVVYQSQSEAFRGAQLLYKGEADGAKLEVPEEAVVILLQLSSEEECTITKVYYEGAENNPVKLRYLLLPEKLVSAMQGIFQGTSFMQRRILWQDGLKLWKTSPVKGLGIGAFESKLQTVQQYHYESKYAHNHYVQSLVDAGVFGLALFAATILLCALAVVLARRKEERSALLGALGACVLFMAGQACTDVIFSSAFYLYTAFPVMALICVCSGDALQVKRGRKAFTVLPHAATAVLALWIVLLGLNLYAQTLAGTKGYEGLKKAVKIDRYGRNDYRVSYICSACADPFRTDYMAGTMYEYMEELEKVPSNAAPYYLGYAYLNLGETGKAFKMLERYCLYAPADEENWDEAFRLAMDHQTDTEDFIGGVSKLYQSMLDWNETSLNPIKLPKETKAFITNVTGME